MRILLAVAAALASSAANAAIPLINGTCPGDIDVHADAGGPVYLNGREARLQRFSDSYYEASDDRTTVSISINPDESVSLSYTQPDRVHGVCTVKADERSESSVDDRRDRRRPPPDRREATVMSILPNYCRSQAALRFGVRSGEITTAGAIRQPSGYIVQGWYKAGAGTKFFNCRFDERGNFLGAF